MGIKLCRCASQQIGVYCNGNNNIMQEVCRACTVCNTNFRNLLFFRCRNIFGRRSSSEILLREYFSYVNFFYNYACACMQNAHKGRGRLHLPAATARARSTKDHHSALLQAAAAIVRARIFINAHSSPPLSRFTRNFFELDIFSDDAARPKITKIYQTKILRTKKGKLRYMQY